MLDTRFGKFYREDELCDELNVSSFDLTVLKIEKGLLVQEGKNIYRYTEKGSLFCATFNGEDGEEVFYFHEMIIPFLK